MFFIGRSKSSVKNSTSNGWVVWKIADFCWLFHLMNLEECAESQLNCFTFTPSQQQTRSILSRGECGSYRCSNPPWPQVYYPTSECTTLTPHHHHLHYNPHQQLANGNVTTGIGINSTAAMPVGGFNQFANCRSTVPPPQGRLQKSLSFAFQTPDTFTNEIWQPNCQNQLGSINYPASNQRNYSRWDWSCELGN